MGDKEIHSGSWKRVGRDFRHALWGWLFREIRQLCASIFVRRMS